jgi:hypothetical protein
MTKYVAGVTQVPRPGIRKWTAVAQGIAAPPTADMSPAEQVELRIEDGPEDPRVVIPRAGSRELAGDTRREDLHAAFEQADWQCDVAQSDLSSVDD